MSDWLLSLNMHVIRPRECVHDALYLVGELKPNYPVPALADTAMVLTLGCICNHWDELAWDGIWRDELPEYVR